MVTVEITLPDTVYGRAESLAHLTGRSVAEIVTTTLDLSLPSSTNEATPTAPLTELSDAAVLALADAQMEPAQATQLAALLDRQQAGTLTDAERGVLREVMQHYQVGLLRKAHALQEAVARGLRAPLT